MANFNQAPLLKHKGEKAPKNSKWSNIRSQELEHILFTQIGAQSTAELKIMLVLTGQAANKFRISQAWIEEHTGISHSSYIRARDSLVKKGWLIHNKSDELIVDFDQIYQGTTVEP